MSLCTGADISAILTFVLLVVGYVKYQYGLWRKSKRLEVYLREVKIKDQRTGTQGQHTFFNIISNVGLTEDEIIQISFRNKRIVRRVHASSITGKADELLFEYVDK
jgi:hypothetical protein